VEGHVSPRDATGSQMKANKQFDPAAAGSESGDKREPDEATAGEGMQQSAVGGAPRKARGRLNRATLSRLGKALDAYFEVVRKEGVPERFKRLLDGHDVHQSLHLQRNGGATDKGHSL
jgi:hypothetical protein